MLSILKLLGLGGGSVPVKTVSVEEAAEAVKTGSHKLIDVRTMGEWTATGRAGGSRGVTLQDPAFVQKVSDLVDGDQAAPIMLICRTGARSHSAARKLISAGFTDVTNVKGGMLAWLGQQLPVQR